tara:strand:+ start:339 stop:563 length:225 start_codon:yes stop_codon:yes gene_type:complete
MKKLLSNPLFYVCSWFAAVAVFAVLMSSCSSYVHCDAYGETRFEKEPDFAKKMITYKIMTPERAEVLAKRDSEK